MDIKDAILIATGILDLILGSVVLLRNPKNRTYISFTFFSFSLAGWALGVALFRITEPSDLALIWAKAYYVSASLIAVSLLYFVSVFPEGKPLSNKRKVLIILTALTHTALLSIPGYLTKSIVVHDWGKEVVLGKVEYLVYTLYFLPFFYGALFILWSKYRKHTGIIKNQILFVFISILIASVFGVIFNLFLPWIGIYKFIYIGPPFTMLIFWIVSYAIIRHKLWDFKLVFARVIVHALLLVVIAGLYSFFMFSISTSLLSDVVRNREVLFGGIFTLLIALTFQPLKKFLEKNTDRIIHYGGYDSDQFLSTLAHIMSTNIDLNQLSTQILQTLISEMKIARGAFVLKADSNHSITISLGFSSTLDKSHYHLTSQLNQHGIILFDEIEEGNLKQEMRLLGIAIAKVLHIKEETIGFLLLGEKASGEMYSEQDLKVLDILAPEVAVAIQNAESYSKIKEFNITLSKEVERATKDLANANVRLKELDHLKDDFVSIASHELRTPMTAIRSYAWMALNRPDIPLSEKMKKYLSRTLISTERLINLVNDMLNVSRIEAGNIEIRPRAFDMVALAGEVMAEVSAKAAEKSLHLQVIPAQIPQVFADPDKVHQVLLNLVGNALKFTPNEGLISIQFFTDGRVVEVGVKDTGTGITPEDQARLFKKFGRLDNSYVAAATAGGTGLGLYISKSLIDLMHGKIWANSEGLGKGSTFAFSLPVATPAVIAQAAAYATKPAGEVKNLEPVAI